MRNKGEIIFCHDGYCGATLIQNSHKKLVKRSKHFKCFFIKQQSSRHQIMGLNKKKDCGLLPGNQTENTHEFMQLFFSYQCKNILRIFEDKVQSCNNYNFKKQEKKLSNYSKKRNHIFPVLFFSKTLPLKICSSFTNQDDLWKPLLIRYLLGISYMKKKHNKGAQFQSPLKS